MRMSVRHRDDRIAVATAALLLLGALLTGPTAVAQSDDGLEGLLEDVGEAYARAYAAPIIFSFGPNMNSGLYSTASIPQTRLTIGFGLKFMAAHLNEADQNFRRVIPNVDLTQFDSSLPPGTTGTVVMSGPTVFGDPDVLGTIEGYVAGVQVFQEDGIEGLVESRYSPLLAPEISAGGIMGFRATLRYFPELDLGDLGKTELMGFGLQWSANGVIPTLPVDVMIGFFRQNLKIGGVIDANASSVFIGASKSFPALTVYGGLAKESSDMTVSYTYQSAGQDISFEVDGVQKSRVTLGATLDILAKLNLELGQGDLTTYSAGLMFGF